MHNIKQLGIYMDHAHAFLMELENGMILSRNILSGCIETENKQLQAAYYNEISDIIRHYQQVVLFGPTDAKNELHNLLTDNHLFSNILIKLVDTDKLTDADMHKFVKEYFN
jgi:hypothetical protein